MKRVFLFIAIFLNQISLIAMERYHTYKYVQSQKPKEEKEAEAKAERAEQATKELTALLLSAPPAYPQQIVTTTLMKTWTKAEFASFMKKVKELLGAGANPNEIIQSSHIPSGYSESGTTTLLKHAILLKYPKLVQLLLEHGADANLKQTIPNQITTSPLMFALNTLNPSKESTLPIITLLLQHQANPHFKDRNGNTVLFPARTAEIVQLLLNYGADPNIKNNQAEAVLTSRTENGEWNIVRVLLDSNPNINITNSTGKTALMISATTMDATGHPSDGAARMFIEYGANLNIQDNDGNTALIHAILHNNEPMVKLLLENGADLTIKNNAGQTALDIAQQGENGNIVNLLQHPPALNPIRKLE